MPRRTDLESILIIGSGPIVIGQACEFDYSGTQACRVLRDEGYRVVLVNSNPATIMTDPEFADATYVEPLDVDEPAPHHRAASGPTRCSRRSAARPRSTSRSSCTRPGVLDEFDVELIGASVEAIHTAEDRSKFKAAMQRDRARRARAPGSPTRSTRRCSVADEVGYPVICRPSFILGGGGTGIAHDDDELRARRRARPRRRARSREILLEQSVVGWKEYELEVMRDHADNVVVICSIENFDPMGVHTGDSITVAPAQTLTDVEYQRMRDAAFACIRRIGVDTGGSNVQFAVNPVDGEMVVIEMNPRVSRSSALASKATGFPIAKIAAKLAVGYRLDEVTNDITGVTPASFEPTIDYVVTKIPRWAFEKLPGASPVLGTMMQSVGEAMAIGRTFPESLQKALRSLETGLLGPEPRPGASGGAPIADLDTEELVRRGAVADAGAHLPGRGRARPGRDASSGCTRSPASTRGSSTRCCRSSRSATGSQALDGPARSTQADWRRAKRLGFGDAQLADLWGADAGRGARRAARRRGRASPTRPSTPARPSSRPSTPYHYGTYEDEDEVAPIDATDRRDPRQRPEPHRPGRRVRLLLRARRVRALRRRLRDRDGQLQPGDGLDRLRHQRPAVLRAAHDRRRPQRLRRARCASRRAARSTGVVVALGGQTPLKLAHTLEQAGIPVLGTSPDSIDLAEDRDRFNALCERLGSRSPPAAPRATPPRRSAIAERHRLPGARPAVVRARRARDADRLRRRRPRRGDGRARGARARSGARAGSRPSGPRSIDRFLEDAIEVDVDALRDRTGEVLIGGVMEHIEEAGVHSGDSACAIPPPTLTAGDDRAPSRSTRAALADALDVRGLLNVQYAVKDGAVFVIEANPRASRTVPFVSKATGVPLAKVAARVMVGATLAELRDEGLLRPPAEGGHVAVKEAVLPFNRFPEVDTILGPEMRSTGEVMGIDRSFGLAFAKSQAAAGNRLPEHGHGVPLARRPRQGGRARRGPPLRRPRVPHRRHRRHRGGAARPRASRSRPSWPRSARSTGMDAVDLISSGKVDLVVNTPRGRGPRADGDHIRRAAIVHQVPVRSPPPPPRSPPRPGSPSRRAARPTVRSLQEYHADGQLRLEV